MIDFRGEELNIGDNVGVVLTSGTRVANLYKGYITGFCNRSGYECATIKINDKNSFWNNYTVNRSSTKVVKI